MEQRLEHSLLTVNSVSAMPVWELQLSSCLPQEQSGKKIFVTVGKTFLDLRLLLRHVYVCDFQVGISRFQTSLTSSWIHGRKENQPICGAEIPAPSALLIREIFES